LAVGHSARDVYESLLSHNVLMSPKDFAGTCILLIMSFEHIDFIGGFSY
jgi:hypothetical protein